MKRIAIAVLACMTVSCKSTGDIQARPAIADYVSQKPVTDIATCISLALADRGGSAKMARTETGVTLSESIPVAGISSVVAVVAIDDAQSHRTITIHSVGKAPKDRTKLDAIYRPCL
ncbi:hypothetical protein GG804_12900 [Sphingomonas histidinilytica]|uniref:hypothetical protein n=1 Tax=Rhizorhabdus histidinilytica TaxID=439228 RepID=UPI001ADC0BC9|nr:hypothetical protein [Rhizorhabdus histidinilytica]MBO9377668.1 hypothetical protein [Rhizorhabdus histidinilytica]